MGRTPVAAIRYPIARRAKHGEFYVCTLKHGRKVIGKALDFGIITEDDSFWPYEDIVDLQKLQIDEEKTKNMLVLERERYIFETYGKLLRNSKRNAYIGP